MARFSCIYNSSALVSLSHLISSAVLETTRLIASRERRLVHRTRADLRSTFPHSISEPSSSHRYRHRPCPHLTSLPPPLCLGLPLGTTSLITRTNPTATREGRQTRTSRNKIRCASPACRGVNCSRFPNPNGVESPFTLAQSLQSSYFFFFLNTFPCALGYRTLCSTSLYVSMRVLLVSLLKQVNLCEQVLPTRINLKETNSIAKGSLLSVLVRRQVEAIEERVAQRV